MAQAPPDLRFQQAVSQRGLNLAGLLEVLEKIKGLTPGVRRMFLKQHRGLRHGLIRRSQFPILRSCIMLGVQCYLVRGMMIGNHNSDHVRPGLIGVRN